MSNHTPGPWTLQPIGDETECNVLGKGRELVATVSDNDARLIAEAPAMREALTRAAISLDILADSECPGCDADNPHAVKAADQAMGIRAILARIDGGK